MSERSVLFEVGSATYGLPIEGVLEVAESGPIWAVPSLPPILVGVANHHGETLPVVSREALFEELPGTLPEPSHVLVLGSEEGAGRRLGVPVDRVVGLVDGAVRPSAGVDLIVERRPVRGRLVAFLDASKLVERAARAIDESQGGRE